MLPPAKWSSALIRATSVQLKSSMFFFPASLRQSADGPFDSLLLGDPAKAEKKLGWKRKVDFDALVKEMVEADMTASKSLVEDQN